MIQNMARIALASSRIHPANVLKNFEETLAAIHDLKRFSPDFIMLASMSMTGAGCADILSNSLILDACNTALVELCHQTNNVLSVIIVGLPVYYGGRVVDASAVVYRGKVLGIVPQADSGIEDKTYVLANGKAVPMSCDLIFKAPQFSFAVECEPSFASAPSPHLKSADIVLAPCAIPALAGFSARFSGFARARSRDLSCAYAALNTGYGEPVSRFVYLPCACICEKGETMASEFSYKMQGITSIADADIDIVRAGSPAFAPAERLIPIPHKLNGNEYILREIAMAPYLPGDIDRKMRVYDELFYLQTLALAGKMQGSGIDRLIIGVSGGLDSTLALMAACAAMDALELPHDHVIGVMMPGFGTSDVTYYNASKLISLLGVTRLEIPIKAAVSAHFEDIGHNPALKDTVYENAQARERTQILFDLGNQYHALNLCTGDLSEAALGWCTFGGDQMGNYAINAYLYKSAIRGMIHRLSTTAQDKEISFVLSDILDTPVSPELVADGGEISQKTEEILGAYEVHDFYLYYFIRYSFSPEKLFAYAKIAFLGKYKPSQLKSWLRIFFTRFFASQFKRTCSPEGAKIWDVSVYPPDYSMPSELDAGLFLKSIEALTTEE